MYFRTDKSVHKSDVNDFGALVKGAGVLDQARQARTSYYIAIEKELES